MSKKVKKIPPLSGEFYEAFKGYNTLYFRWHTYLSIDIASPIVFSIASLP